MDKKKNDLPRVIILIVVGFILITFYCLHCSAVMNMQIADGKNANELLSMIDGVSHMIQQPFSDLFPVNFRAFIFPMTLYVLFVLWELVEREKRQQTMIGKEKGTGGWYTDYFSMDKFNAKYTFPKKDKKVKEDFNGENKNMIFGDDLFLNMNTRDTRLNNNVLVIGGSGTGKSRFFVKPNLLQKNCSYVVTDPSGELLETCGKFLENDGYKIKIFNLVEMEKSNHYNPFEYIRDENGVSMMIKTLISNTNEGKSGGDPFWEKSEEALLSAICHYLVSEVKKEERNFANVLRLIRLAEVDENDPDAKSTLDLMFDELEKKKGEGHIAVKNYKTFKMGAGKTLKSILISASVRLNPFNLQKVAELTNTDNLELVKMGDEKTALFVIIPAADSTFNFLVAMMYSQLFESLYFHAENECKGKRLTHHVRFMLDEFANIGTIPDFDKKLATMRKYEISCSVILQNLSQLSSMYKDGVDKVIIGNCDSILFLGSSEPDTAKWVSEKLGRATIKATSGQLHGKTTGSLQYSMQDRELMTAEEITRMPNDECIVFIRSLRPFRTNKYDLERHPNYKYTGDADSNLNYKIESKEKEEAPKTKAKRELIDIRSKGKDNNLLNERNIGQRKRQQQEVVFGNRQKIRSNIEATPENLNLPADEKKLEEHMTRFVNCENFESGQQFEVSDDIVVKLSTVVKEMFTDDEEIDVMQADIEDSFGMEEDIMGGDFDDDYSFNEDAFFDVSTYEEDTSEEDELVTIDAESDDEESETCSAFEEDDNDDVEFFS